MIPVNITVSLWGDTRHFHILSLPFDQVPRGLGDFCIKGAWEESRQKLETQPRGTLMAWKEGADNSEQGLTYTQETKDHGADDCGTHGRLRETKSQVASPEAPPAPA